jgi:hypothetical protein
MNPKSKGQTPIPPFFSRRCPVLIFPCHLGGNFNFQVNEKQVADGEATRFQQNTGEESTKRAEQKIRIGTPRVR